MLQIPSYQERLKDIVQYSYKILCCKIAEGEFEINNEASLQHQLSIIIKQIGQLFLFSSKESFIIELERKVTMMRPTNKSPKIAKCDIWFTIRDDSNIKSECAIEVKFFKYCKNTEATTDNRFSLLLDLENLEQYKRQTNNLLCYSIVYTTNENYTKKNTSSGIKLTPTIISSFSRKLTKYVRNQNGGKKAIQQTINIHLDKEYPACWDIYKITQKFHGFLMVDMN